MSFFENFRKKTFPPSINDAAWRHQEIVDRIRELAIGLQGAEQSVSARLNELDARTAENYVALKQFLTIQAIAPTSSQADVRALLRLLRPYGVEGAQKIRVGDAGDGGYVMLDDVKNVSHALSFGVNDNDSWDLALAQRGVPVEQFDHTILRAPSEHALLRFHQKKIAASSSPDCAALPDLIAEHSKLQPPDIILKMDIEGDEWAVLEACPPELLSKCRQILCEFHDLHKLGTAAHLARIARIIEKLTANFFVFHVHGNNCAPLVNVCNVALPDVVEFSLANRSFYKSVACDEIFPTLLDAPNNSTLPDIFLGNFCF